MKLLKNEENKTYPWYKFYKGFKANLDYPKCTMYELIYRSAQAYPSYIAYSYYGNKVTYRSFMNKIDDVLENVPRTYEGLKEYLENDDIKQIKVDIKNTFNNDDFEKEKALIKGEFDEKRNVLMEKLNKDSEKHGFQVKSAQNGIYMMPILNGKTIEQEDFEKLDESIKQQFEEKSVIVQEQIIQAIGEIKEIEKQTAKRLEEWQSNIALLTVNQHINYIKSKFKRNKKITKFLDSIKKDILKNIDYFLVEPGQEQANVQQAPNPRPEIQKPWLNYRVNLFVDNSNQEGAPVIMDSNYSYQNLFGKRKS